MASYPHPFVGEIAMYRKASFTSVVLLAVGVFHCCSGILLRPARAQSDQDTFTPEQLEKIYQELPAEDKPVVDSWSAAEREKYLRTRAKMLQMASTLHPKLPPRDYNLPENTLPLYSVDPLLKEAMTKYGDEKIPRQEVLALFEKYLKQTPDSVFLPEIYFQMGALYSMARRPGLGEKYDRQKMIEYFQKAHALYGTKYSHLHVTAWASLANMRESGLEFRKGYLRWLQRLMQSDVNDVWPIREIEQTFNGRAPELSVADREVILKNLQDYQDIDFDTASKCIFHIERGNPRSLADLAKSFPGTELARQCLLSLGVKNQVDLDALGTDGASTSVPHNEKQQSSGLAPGASGSTAEKDAGDPSAGTDPNSGSRAVLLSEKASKSSPFRISAWCAGLVALVTIGLYVGRQRMRTRAATKTESDDSATR
jgi:tetratricopeptide (TPR) repeat protein